MMSLQALMLVDESGLAIARYPDGEGGEENLQLFSAMLVSLYKSSKDLGFGELEEIHIGGKKYVISPVGDNFLISILSKDDKIEDWYLDLLRNSLKTTISYSKSDVGFIKEYEANFFRNVLKILFEKYDELTKTYNDFKDTVESLYKEKGVDVLEKANTITLPDMEVWEENNSIVLRNIRISDAERFKELLEWTVSALKEIEI